MHIDNINKKTNYKFFFLVVMLLLFIYLTSFAYYDINMSADNIEYDEITHQLKCNNNVIISYQGTKLYANYISLFVKKKNLIANGMVKIEDIAHTIYADALQYNYGNNDGRLVNGTITLGNVFIKAGYIKKKQDVYLLHNITLSNCDFDHPHVSLNSTKGKLILNNRLILYSTKLYIWKIPILYLPIIAKSLCKDTSLFPYITIRCIPNMRPNKLNILLTKFKNKVTLPINKYLTTLLIYNILEKKHGADYGINCKYLKSEDKNITFDIVMTNYKNNFVTKQIGDKKNLIIFPNIIWAFNNKWVIRSYSEFINNIPIVEYNRQNKRGKDVNKVIDILNRLNSYFIISRQFNKIHVDILADYIMLQNKYIKKSYYNYVILPQIYLCSFYNKYTYDIYHKFDLSSKNFFYKERNDYIQKNLNLKNVTSLNYFIKKNFPVNDKITLTATLQMTSRLSLIQYIVGNQQETAKHFLFNLNSLLKYNHCNQSFKTTSGLLPQCNGTLNCRSRFYDWWDCNIYYYYGNIYENSFRTHNVTVSNDIFILDNMHFRSAFIYNFYKTNIYKMNSIIPNVNKNIPQFCTELVWTPHEDIDLYFNFAQSLYPVQCNYYNLYFTIKDPADIISCTIGTFYLRNNYKSICQQQQLLNNFLGVDLSIIPKWKLNYSLKNFTNEFEQNCKLFRDIHCYRLGIVWKMKNKCHSFHLNFSMNMNIPKVPTLDKDNKPLNKLLNYFKST
jgi:hypothetical protein